MREKFAQNFPELKQMEGVAHNLPFFESDMFDVIFVGQAFHWFANEESLKEMARVLKPGGTLVLIWNMEDNSIPWISRLREQYEIYEQDTPQFRLGLWRAVWNSAGAEKLFDCYNETQSRHVPVIADKTLIWERILSKSYISSLEKSEQEILKQKVEKILDEEMGEQENQQEEIEYPQKTTIFTAKKRK